MSKLLFLDDLDAELDLALVSLASSGSLLLVVLLALVELNDELLRLVNLELCFDLVDFLLGDGDLEIAGACIAGVASFSRSECDERDELFLAEECLDAFSFKI